MCLKMEVLRGGLGHKYPLGSSLQWWSPGMMYGQCWWSTGRGFWDNVPKKLKLNVGINFLRFNALTTFLQFYHFVL